MDESWRMRMGMTATKQPNIIPSRRSTEETTSSNRQNVFRGYETLDPDDFDDVFGGPPRSVLSRQYSVDADLARSTTLFYEDIFRKPKDYTASRDRSNRTLPEFSIPTSRKEEAASRNEEEFYRDIFGDHRLSRSRSKSKSNSKPNSKSKSNSSSVLSSEELSPLRPAIVDEDDVFFSCYASKLRPINVASKWNTSESEHILKFKGYHPGSSQRVSSPEIISFGPNSYSSVKESLEDLQLKSPSSVVSSLCHEQEDEATTIHEGRNIDPEEDDITSSYIIEINPSDRERVSEALGIDEAIAWAKQKCQTRTEQHESEERPRVNLFPEVQTSTHGSSETATLEKLKEWEPEEPVQQLEKDMELELLDEDIRLWSAGKEPNIRLLLSTLHHILWPNSGWKMIPLTSLEDSSNVKKAYQKARLCLHPDKLQQRGATLPQKYVAEKAFPILQDAWALFISQDVCSSIT